MFFLCLLYSLCVMLFIILTLSEWSSLSVIFHFRLFRIYIYFTRCPLFTLRDVFIL